MFQKQPTLARSRRSPSKQLGDYAELDTVVSVVDGAKVLEQMRNSCRLPANSGSMSSFAKICSETEGSDNSARSIARVLSRQIEFADVLVLNKVDQMSEVEREAARE